MGLNWKLNSHLLGIGGGAITLLRAFHGHLLVLPVAHLVLAVLLGALIIVILLSLRLASRVIDPGFVPLAPFGAVSAARGARGRRRGSLRVVACFLAVIAAHLTFVFDTILQQIFIYSVAREFQGVPGKRWSYLSLTLVDLLLGVREHHIVVRSVLAAGS